MGSCFDVGYVCLETSGGQNKVFSAPKFETPLDEEGHRCGNIKYPDSFR